jgi:hypothetical protein
MAHWECKQHGKGCLSYVQATVNEFNEKGITPDTIPAYEIEFAGKCMKWVK